MNNRLPPIYFPTTVALIDDDPIFLERLQFTLSASPSSFLSFSSAVHAKQSLVPKINLQKGASTWLSRCEDSEGFEERVIDIKIGAMHKELYIKNRFEEISCMVVDYQMPHVNGLELCRSIKNLKVQKILLTGAVDESFAIDALNSGVIDHYLDKSDPDLSIKLKQAITNAQKNYFWQRSLGLWQETNFIDEVGALTDPVWLNYFYKCQKDFQAVEYYMIEAKGSFLFVDKAGKLGGLFTNTDETWNSVHDSHHEKLPPSDLGAALRR